MAIQNVFFEKDNTDMIKGSVIAELPIVDISSFISNKEADTQFNQDKLHSEQTVIEQFSKIHQRRNNFYIC